MLLTQPMPQLARSLSILILSCAFVLTNTASTNFTIDDYNGDQITGLKPSYSPILGWNQGNDCSECTAKLDATKTFMGTWHDVSYQPTDPEPRVITLSFNGMFLVFSNNTD